MLLRCVTPTTASLLCSRVSVTVPRSGISVSSVQLASRHKIYGVEEGHHIKNEVRKEKWIRKRMRRPLGGDWREEQGLARSGNEGGYPLTDNPDWSYADGRPGIPSFKQIKRMIEQRQYAVEIKEALEAVKFAQNAVVEQNQRDEGVREEFRSKKLKSKGKKTFSDML